MQSIRQLFQRCEWLTGEQRHTLRHFNNSPFIKGRARSVKDLALALGFDVTVTRLPYGMSGRLVRDPFSENGWCIEVSELDNVLRQRFTVLHELGHWLLHRKDEDIFAPDFARDTSGITFYDDPKQEREANQVASVLLFGDGGLTAAASLNGSNIASLSKQFGVSEKVIEVALREYGADPWVPKTRRR